jgi:hypothetical protein
MSKHEENPELLRDFKGGSQNIVEMAKTGADQNLNLSEYYVLGSHSQI